MNNPKISIIVPVYNVEKYLRECLDSILCQTFTDWECILVDDGSTDGSGMVCDEYASLCNKIRVYHQKNRGVSSARNLGIEKTKGKWLIFVDADDIMLNNGLQCLYESVISMSADIAMGGSNLLINGIFIPFHTYQYKYSDKVLENTISTTLWEYLFNVSIIKVHGLRFVEGLAYSEDQVFIATYSLYCNSIIQIPDPVYIYRISETSACASKNWLLKASSQFQAAYEIYKLIVLARKKHEIKALLQKCKYLKNLGCLSYIQNGDVSFHSYKLYNSIYRKYFSCSVCLFMNTFKVWLNYKRSRVVSWRDNPIEGRVGLKSALRRVI